MTDTTGIRTIINCFGTNSGFWGATGVGCCIEFFSVVLVFSTSQFLLYQSASIRFNCAFQITNSGQTIFSDCAFFSGIWCFLETSFQKCKYGTQITCPDNTVFRCTIFFTTVSTARLVIPSLAILTLYALRNWFTGSRRRLYDLFKRKISDCASKYDHQNNKNYIYKTTLIHSHNFVDLVNIFDSMIKKFSSPKMRNRQFIFTPKIEYKLVAERSKANL